MFPPSLSIILQLGFITLKILEMVCLFTVDCCYTLLTTIHSQFAYLSKPTVLAVYALRNMGGGYVGFSSANSGSCNINMRYCTNNR